MTKLFYLTFFTALICSCNEFDEPGLINNPDQIFSKSPVITSVNPAGVAVAGVREIEIIGSNFAVDEKDTNWIFIGGEPADVKSVSENKIVVYRPAAFGDDIGITVVIPNALNVAQVLDYKIEDPIEEFGDFTRENYDLMSLAVDADENLFVATRRKVLKLSSDGINLTTLVSLGSTFAKITDLKFGYNSLLYAAVSKKDKYVIDPVTGEEQKYVTLSRNTEKLDFDQNGNLYTGKRDG